MLTPAQKSAPEDSLAALREEIRRAGRNTATQRRTSWQIVVGGLTLVVLCLSSYVSNPPSFQIVSAITLAAVAFVPVALVGCIVSSALAWYDRRMCRQDFRERVLKLSPAARKELLDSFALDDGDAFEIVRPLIGGSGGQSELTPAGTPEGSGAEVGGVEGLFGQDHPLPKKSTTRPLLPK